jgi:hypothetical protein
MSDFPPDPMPAAILAFPGNVMQVLETRFLAGITDVDVVAKRPLTPLDPSFSIGLVALNWQPGDHEIGSASSNPGTLGRVEPSTGTYHYLIQALIKHSDALEGLAYHGLFTKQVRAMLYRDPGVRLGLAALTEKSMGVTERLQKWGIGAQRFASNEIDSEWLYLSTTELWVETETTP